MRKLVSAVLGAVFALAAGNPFSFAQTKNVPDDALRYNKPATELRMAMRKLWADHVIWTGHYTTSALADLGDVKAVTERLLKNQDDIGNAIKPYYGQDAGSKLAALLRSHIQIATEVVKAAREGNQSALKSAQDKWRANAAEIASFLSSANPNWNMKELRDMLYTHLEILTGEVTNRLKSNWTGYVNDYDKNFDHMLKFADVLTDGIIKQFPDKFSQ